jgi:hypothetical protein
MIGPLIIGVLALDAVGILLVSFVQTRIIREHGIWHFQKRGFKKVYWHDRTKAERWCFWIGAFLAFLPFIIVGIVQVISILTSRLGGTP